ncbi:hypothetical protein HRbin27_02066 [bacterium HR27]|nr:hypothetical protein HRbin27_02066 [bacterium HR27]
MPEGAGAQRSSVGSVVVSEKLRLDPRHVDARWALALAGLAGKTQIEHLVGARIGEMAWLEDAASQRVPQGIGPCPRRIALVAGRHVGGAHRTAADFPADASTVAHLDRAEKAAVLFEAEERLRFDRVVVRPVPQVLVERWTVDDLAGVEQVEWVESGFQFAHALVEGRAEQQRVEFSPGEAVPVLAAQDPTEPLGEFERALGERSHRPHTVSGLQVHERANVEAAGAGVGVECCSGAMLGDEAQDLADVLCQMFDWDRDVLDAGDRLVVAANTVEEAESGFANRPHVSLTLPVADGDGISPDLLLLDEVHELPELVLELGFAVGIVLDHEERFRITTEEGDARSVTRLLPCQPNEHTVHQFDCRGAGL